MDTAAASLVCHGIYTLFPQMYVHRSKLTLKSIHSHGNRPDIQYACETPRQCNISVQHLPHVHL